MHRGEGFELFHAQEDPHRGRPDGNGWIIMNKYLQVETRYGAVCDDGVFFVVGAETRVVCIRSRRSCTRVRSRISMFAGTPTFWTRRSVMVAVHRRIWSLRGDPEELALAL